MMQQLPAYGLSTGNSMIQATITCHSATELRELAAFLQRVADLREKELQEAIRQQQEYAQGAAMQSGRVERFQQ
jgi:hypothetical protein